MATLYVSIYHVIGMRRVTGVSLRRDTGAVGFASVRT
jgi:hypothetical protein